MASCLLRWLLRDGGNLGALQGKDEVEEIAEPGGVEVGVWGPPHP